MGLSGLGGTIPKTSAEALGSDTVTATRKAVLLHPAVNQNLEVFASELLGDLCKLSSLSGDTLRRELRLLLLRIISYSAGFGAGLDRFLFQISAPSSVSRLFLELERFTKASAYYQNCALCSDRDLIELSQAAIEWFLTRLSTLERIEEIVDQSGAAIFDPSVAYNQYRSATRGLTLICRMYFEAQYHAAYWLRLRVFEDGQPVTVADGWESWVDEAGCFAVLTPLQPVFPRTICDQIELFVPLGALQLRSNNSQAELELELSDPNLAQIAKVRVPVLLEKLEQNHTVVSPQALGAWAKDLVLENQISALKYRTTVREERGLLHESLCLFIDLECFGCDDQELYLECKVSGSADTQRDSEYTHKLALLIRHPFSRFQNIKIEIPCYLCLRDSEDSIVCDVVLFTAMGEPLCGISELLRLERWLSPKVPLLDVNRATEGALLRSIQLNPSTPFRGQSVLRVDVALEPSQFIHPFARLLLTLEDSSGAVLTSRSWAGAKLARSLLITQSNSRAVLHIPHHEIFGVGRAVVGHPANPEGRVDLEEFLTAHLVVFGASEQVLAEYREPVNFDSIVIENSGLGMQSQADAYFAEGQVRLFSAGVGASVRINIRLGYILIHRLYAIIDLRFQNSRTFVFELDLEKVRSELTLSDLHDHYLQIGFEHEFSDLEVQGEGELEALKFVLQSDDGSILDQLIHTIESGKATAAAPSLPKRFSWWQRMRNFTS